jgi:hypothetical protein
VSVLTLNSLHSFFLRSVLFSLLFFLAASCHWARVNPARAIPVFSLDDHQRVRSHLIPHKIYVKQVGTHLKALQGETAKALTHRLSTTGPFRPVQVILGLGLTFDLGFTPIYSLSLRPSFQLWFRKVDAWNQLSWSLDEN